MGKGRAVRGSKEDRQATRNAVGAASPPVAAAYKAVAAARDAVHQIQAAIISRKTGNETGVGMDDDLVGVVAEYEQMMAAVRDMAAEVKDALGAIRSKYGPTRRIQSVAGELGAERRKRAATLTLGGTIELSVPA